MCYIRGMNILLNTGNREKRDEYTRIVARYNREQNAKISLEFCDYDVPEIQSLSPAVVARQKVSTVAQYYSAHSQYDLILAEDVGLSFRSLGAFPGALIKWAETVAQDDFLYRMSGEDKTAIVTVALASAYPVNQWEEIWCGTLSGTVIDTPVGEYGFGFDKVFVPTGYNRTIAQMAPSERDVFSPRAIAFRQMIEAYSYGKY